MKQRITIDQLKELSVEGKEKLRKWWNPEEGDRFTSENTEGVWGNQGKYKYLFNSEEKIVALDTGPGVGPMWIVGTAEAYPLLSIGQMIGFINEHQKNTEWTIKFIRLHSKHKFLKGYPKHLLKKVWLMFGEGNDVQISNDELCDALWMACKEVLEPR